MMRVSSCALRLSVSTFSHTAAKLNPGDETCANFPNGQDNGSGSATPAANQWLHAVMPKEKVRRLMICVLVPYIPSAPSSVLSAQMVLGGANF